MSKHIKFFFLLQAWDIFTKSEYCSSGKKKILNFFYASSQTKDTNMTKSKKRGKQKSIAFTAALHCTLYE